MTRPSRGKAFRALLVMTVLVALLVAACGGGKSTQTKMATGRYTIALSNSFLGNSWRQTMVRIFDHVAAQAKSEGLIKDFKVENTAENTATEQAAQINTLILQHVDAILIDSASPTALNPTIEKACRANIVVVVFDSLASAPCEYNLEDSIYQYGYQEADYVAKGMGGKGNVIIARGVVGSAPEAVIFRGQQDALKQYPDIHVVATVDGEASNEITEKAIAGILPSLPPVQGVITGGSSFGAVQAFQNAGRPLPVVAFDNSGDALQFWQQQHQKNGYNAVSLRTEPGQVAAAFWEALDILGGTKSYPKGNQTLTFPNLVVTPDNLDQWVKVVPPGSVCAYLWTRDEFHQEVQRIKAKQPLMIPPIPTMSFGSL